MQKIWSSKSKRSHPSADEPINSNVSESIMNEAPASQLPQEQQGEGLDDSLSPTADVEPETATEENSENSELEELDRSPSWLNWELWQYCPDWLKPKQAFAWSLQDIPWSWLIVAIGCSGVAITALWGLQFLTDLDAKSDESINCQSKISGDWQTGFGKLSLQENSSQQVTGKYTYTNFDRGQVQGEFTGELRNNIVNFTWEETPNTTAKISSQQVATEKGKGTFVFTSGCLEFYGSYGTGDSTNNFGNWQGYRISKTK
ncbi:MAG: hypothetical protein NW214_13770 [Pseudanabaenaceae cyanobacterium bins.39]|nr:hypothetical protein [Pseudanabaenaceae cyanobacterium bins.39]